MLREHAISTAILDQFSAKLRDNLDVDVAMVGAGPSALVAARDLAMKGFKVAIFERKLAPGGGTWGGGMLFNEVVLQDDALPIAHEFGLRTVARDETGYHTVDSVELASGLIFCAVQSGATIFNAVTVEDIVFHDERVGGVVINWTPVMLQGMHVDPLTVMARAVLDGTGHPGEITRLAANKAGVTLDTTTGGIVGERPMWADSGEASTVENTGALYPGLYVSGMAANNAHGGYRMGPIFGGMLLSGRKVAGQIEEELRG